MRTPLIMLPVMAALVALGCTDGPNDPYQPGPPNAGWNSGNASYTTDGGEGYDAGFPSTGKTVLCSTDLKRQRWAWMLQQPIIPPRKYAGLDMAKNDNWDGLRIDDAESPPLDPNMTGGGLCQSIPLGFQGTCGSGFGGCNGSAWGNNYEVLFFWNVATHLVDQMQLNLGYTGALKTIAYPDHQGEMHAWTVAVGDIIRRDGLAFEIGWTDTATFQQQTTDIFNAAMATFAPQAGVPFNSSDCTKDADCASATQVLSCQCDHTGATGGACGTGKTGKCGFKNCATDGNCLNRNDGSNTYMGFRPIVVYIVGTSGLPQPALSTPAFIYNFFSKWEPYSNLPQVVKIDANGPNATGTPIGAKDPATTCTQEIGQTYEDFVKNCVQVTGDPATDATNLNKVTHSLVHDTEHWTANVLGVNQNFTSSKVAANPDAVVLDSDTPGMGDIAEDWTFDIRARGVVRNDYTPRAGKSPLPNWRGSSLVFIEWARLMLEDIGRITGKPHKLGDPACTGYQASGQPNFEKDPTCSGIEGMIVPYTGVGDGKGQYDFSNDPHAPELDAAQNYDLGYTFAASVLKPGDLGGAFCVDPGVMLDCTADGLSVWQNALKHVTRVMGNGDVLNLPSELQDRRYYYKWFGIAYVKYLKAYGNYNAKYPATVDYYPNGTVGGGLGPSDVRDQQIDLESLFFDFTVQPGTGGAQTFDKFEYIDREFIGAGVGNKAVPWDFEYGCDIFGGNQRYDNWFRRMDREETALYSAMLVDKNHSPGQENNVNITNLFGSQMLGGNPIANVSGIWPSWECAVGAAGDPSVNCIDGSGNQVNPPLDPAQPGHSTSQPCPAGQTFSGGVSYENGSVAACGIICDFTTYPDRGCAAKSQACVGGGDGTGACLEMKMDKNGPNAANPHPLLWYYPGAWGRTAFSKGHSPVTIAPGDKHPNLGVAKVNIPNFKAGPYTYSPLVANTPNCTADADCTVAGSTCNKTLGTCTPTCDAGYSLSANKAWCNADTYTGTSGTTLPVHSALAPWYEVQPAVGFPIPIDAQHNQFVSSGQIDFTGVLESYIVDYVPYVDPAKPGCVADGKCNLGFNCDPNSHSCVTDDNTININAIEGADFLGQAFVCQDPWTGDILHVGMFDSAVSIVDWLQAHPGASYGGGVVPSAQDACQILVIRSPADNFIDFIVSKANGVTLNIGDGQGQGRVVDVILWDPGLTQNL